MRPEELDAAQLQDQVIGPVRVLFGYENGKYPYGNSLLVAGTQQSVIIDPCLGVVARRQNLPASIWFCTVMRMKTTLPVLICFLMYPGGCMKTMRWGYETSMA